MASDLCPCGSIWDRRSVGSAYISWTRGQRRVGDLVTIAIAENTGSIKDNETQRGNQNGRNVQFERQHYWH